MKRITIAIMIITLASKVIGLLREITLSTYMELRA